MSSGLLVGMGKPINFFASQFLQLRRDGWDGCEGSQFFVVLFYFLERERENLKETLHSVQGPMMQGSVSPP